MNKAKEYAMTFQGKGIESEDLISTIRLAILDGYNNGYQQAKEETIDRACEWLFSHLPILLDYYNEDIHEKADRGEFIKLFRTQMEEEQ